MIVINNASFCKASDVGCGLTGKPMKRKVAGGECIENDNNNVALTFSALDQGLKSPRDRRGEESQREYTRDFQEIPTTETVVHGFTFMDWVMSIYPRPPGAVGSPLFKSEERYHKYTKNESAHMRPPGNPTLAAAPDGAQAGI